MENKVEFISYNGEYPCLCSGILEIKVNGKYYKLDHILLSGGSVWFDDSMGEHIEEGPWEISESGLPKELRPYIKQIEKVVNDNVEYGCCGGCI